MWHLALLVGCSREEERPVSSCEDEALEIASEGGISVPEGGEIEFIWGGQGGFHAQLGAWVRTEDTAVALMVRLLDAQGELVAQSSEIPTYVALADHDCEGWAVTPTYLGASFQLDKATACAYDGQEVTVEVEATPLARLDSGEEPLVLSVPGQVRTLGVECR
jgi:hypothetical protein